MGAFLTPLQLEYLDGRRWKVLSPFEYHLGAPEGVEVISIPIGFITDFASIPRALWSLLPPTGGYGKAAVVHDWLYQVRIVADTSKTPVGLRLVERGEADALLREGMEVLGVSRATRWTIFTGVRIGGGGTWRRYRNQERLPPCDTPVLAQLLQKDPP